MKASDFKDGTIIECGKYLIFIKYGEYKRPSLMSYVELKDKPFKSLSCVPGVRNGIPYYVDNFLSR